MAQMLTQKEAEQDAVRAGGKALQKSAAVIQDNRPVPKMPTLAKLW